MDTISYYYFREVSKDLNITRTANRLYISQQTLSNHIQRLEAYYGVRLLERKPFLAMTEAGREVLVFANLLCSEESTLKDVLSDIALDKKGTLRFGSSPQRMDVCIPEALPHFSARYPNINIEISSNISSKLESMVLAGEIDYAVVTASDAESPQISGRHLMRDQLYLCVEDSLLKAYYPNAGQLKEKAVRGTEVDAFSKLPLFMLSNRLGQIVHACFDKKGILPNTYITSTLTRVGCLLCFKGIAACFASHSILSSVGGEIPRTVNIFPLFSEGEPVAQTIKLIWIKNRYVPPYAAFFMDWLYDYYHRLEQRDFIHSADGQAAP